MFSDAGTKTSSRYLVLRKDVLEKLDLLFKLET